MLENTSLFKDNARPNKTGAIETIKVLGLEAIQSDCRFMKIKGALEIF